MQSPFEIFDSWFAEAQANEPNDPNAMALATVDVDGQPSSRMVLLKGHGPDGFVFYTNRQSRKAGELHVVAKAALLFHWKSLRRQVRIEGNRFAVFFPTLLDAQDTDGLVFRGNTVTRSEAYPAKAPDAPAFMIRNCSNVDTGD